MGSAGDSERRRAELAWVCNIVSVLCQHCKHTQMMTMRDGDSDGGGGGGWCYYCHYYSRRFRYYHSNASIATTQRLTIIIDVY